MTHPLSDPIAAAEEELRTRRRVEAAEVRDLCREMLHFRCESGTGAATPSRQGGRPAVGVGPSSLAAEERFEANSYSRLRGVRGRTG